MAQQVIKFNTSENVVLLKPAINKKRNTVEKRHLELDGKSVKIVSDGFVDIDKEIQSQLCNAGLQNILKLQEMRYGTLDNAIARAKDNGVYADVSEIPTSIAEQSEFIANAQAKINQLKQELGLSDQDLAGLDEAKLVELYKAKYGAKEEAPTSPTNDGGNE